MHSPSIRLLSVLYGSMDDKGSGHWLTIPGFNKTFQKILHKVDHYVKLHFSVRSMGVVHEPGVPWLQITELDPGFNHFLCSALAPCVVEVEGIFWYWLRIYS